MKQWEGQINRLIKEVVTRRAAERGVSKTAPQNSTNPAAPRQPSSYSLNASFTDSVYTNGHAHNHRRPSHPNDERVSVTPVSAGLYNGPQGYPPHDGFDQDDDDDFEDYPPASSSYHPSSGRVTPNSNYASSGRGTPMGSRRSNAQSMPPEHDSIPGYDRPRARTEDTNGSVMAQWRSNGLPPPPPSAPSISIRPTTPYSGSSNAQSDPSFAPGGWTSRPALRNQYSATKLQVAYDNGSRTHANGNSSPSSSRSRSVSQPNSYVPKSAAPPLPASVPWASHNSSIKRGSGSSQSTGGSSDYSPNSSSPVTPFGSSESSLGVVRPPRSNHFERVPRSANPHLQLPPVKVKVHFHEDIFVIQVPRSTEYAELVEKVGKKIRLCGPRRDDGPLRVKYKDEDGDMVSLGSTEDVQMAFEQYRPGGQVTLFVT
jgi:cell division control protein 24